MISIEQTRELLGDVALGKTDEELAGIRDRMYGLGQVVVDVFRGLHRKPTAIDVRQSMAHHGTPKKGRKSRGAHHV